MGESANAQWIKFLFGGLVFSCIIFSVLIIGINNNIQVDLDDIRSGKLDAASISADKLDPELFSTVELLDANGNVSKAKILEGTLVDGRLLESVTLVKEDGTTVDAKVIT